MSTWHDRLAINLQNLHQDVANHAVLYAEIAGTGAELKASAHQAKSQLDLAKAEMSAAIRAQPEKYGVPKVTEASIQAALVVNDRVREAEQEYLDAQCEYESVSVIVTAFEHRRSMLNNEVQLHAADYWGTTQSVPVGSNDDLRDERVKEIIKRRKS